MAQGLTQSPPQRSTPFWAVSCPPGPSCHSLPSLRFPRYNLAFLSLALILRHPPCPQPALTLGPAPGSVLHLAWGRSLAWEPQPGVTACPGCPPRPPRRILPPWPQLPLRCQSEDWVGSTGQGPSNSLPALSPRTVCGLDGLLHLAQRAQGGGAESQRPAVRRGVHVRALPVASALRGSGPCLGPTAAPAAPLGRLGGNASSSAAVVGLTLLGTLS